MPFTYKQYDAAAPGHYREVEAGKGVTLYIGSKTYQVMSDIWEQGSFAVYWTGTEIRVQDWIEKGEADATAEVWAAAREWKKGKVYLTHLANLNRKAAEDSVKLVRGCTAKVVRGRKFPVGTEGKVVGFAQSQWGTSVGIATSDKTVEVEKNGRKFQNHVDVIWVAMKNVERSDVAPINEAELDKMAAEYAAQSVQKEFWYI